jgi:hypothetical protein
VARLPLSTLTDAARIGTGVLDRTRDEILGIWQEARALRRKGQTHPEHIGPQSADDVYFAWYLGLATMAIFGVIEWPLAGVIAAAHTVERYGHRQRVKELVEGLDAGV